MCRGTARFSRSALQCTAPCNAQSIFAPVRRMIGPHLAASARIQAANASGLPPAGSSPAAFRRFFTAGSYSAAFNAPFSRCTIASAVPSAITTPFQTVRDKAFAILDRHKLDSLADHISTKVHVDELALHWAHVEEQASRLKRHLGPILMAMDVTG